MGKSLLNLELKIIITIQDSPKLPESFSGCMRVKRVGLDLDLIIFSSWLMLPFPASSSDLLKVRAFFGLFVLHLLQQYYTIQYYRCFTSKMASESRLKPGDRRVIY